MGNHQQGPLAFNKIVFQPCKGVIIEVIGWAHRVSQQTAGGQQSRPSPPVCADRRKGPDFYDSRSAGEDRFDLDFPVPESYLLNALTATSAVFAGRYPPGYLPGGIVRTHPDQFISGRVGRKDLESTVVSGSRSGSWGAEFRPALCRKT